VVSPLLYPDLALLDSLLTIGLPPRITAMTGIDAMVHAIESYTTRLKQNPLSEAFGLSNSLVLVPVLAFNLNSAKARYADLGRAMLPGEAAYDDETAANSFLSAIRNLVAEMPYEQTLRSAGVAESDLPMLATDAMKVQSLLVNNPRDVTFDDALAIYQAAF